MGLNENGEIELQGTREPDEDSTFSRNDMKEVYLEAIQRVDASADYSSSA